MKRGLIGSMMFIILLTAIMVGILLYYKTTRVEPESVYKKSKEIGVNIADLGVIPNDGVDRTKLFQSILDKHRVVWVPKGVYTISSGKYRNGDGSIWWGLKIPSNTTVYFEDGAVLRFKDNMPSWSRVLVIYKAKNVRIEGRVEIDGNCDSVTNGNEHMANLFIESSKNVYIESVYSHDSFGDNVFVGGTEVNPSENIRIDNFKGIRAGRKNFVIHYVNNLHVKRAILDNSNGNSEKGWTGANSIDLEPDNYTGAARFYQRFDYVSTYGKGNDFTVGTSSVNAKNWVLDIGTMDVHRMKRNNKNSEPVMYSYALTTKIDKLNIFIPKGENAVPIKLLYAANWQVNKLSIKGGEKYGISTQYAGNEKPSLVVKQLKMNNINGYGIRNEGGDIQLGTFEARDVSGRVLYNYATSPNSKISVENLAVNNSGDKEVIKVSSYLKNPVNMKIKSMIVHDSRPSKAARLVYFETGAAAKGFTIGSIFNPDKIIEFDYASGLAKKFNPTK